MYDVFLKLLEQRGVRVSDVAKATGIRPSSFSDWKNGKYTPKADKLQLIADYFGVSVNYLIKGKEDTNRVPVLGRVAAGIPIEMVREVIDYEEIDSRVSGDIFALRISGDSMSPRIQHGDVVIVRKQSDAESGDIVIATVNGDDATCKIIRKYKDGIELVPINPAYQPVYYSYEDINRIPISIIGKVIELRAKF